VAVFGTYNDLVSYVRYLCEQHRDLLHDDAKGQRVFFITNVERASAFTNEEIKPKSFCVVITYPDATKSNQQGIMTNTFMLFVGHWSNTTNAANSVDTAMLASYRVLLELIGRMHTDEEGSRIFSGSASSVEPGNASPVENYYANYSGWVLPIRTSHKYQLNAGSTKWLDGGITPPVL
jgi:hypothetical protein